MSKPKHNARRRAVQAIYMWRMTDGNLSDIEQQFLLEQEMKKVDKKYFKELIHNVPAMANEYEEALTPLISRRLAEIDPIEQAVLAIAHYELSSRIDIPYRVVINESIELAKVFGASDSHKFVNGIVDKLARVYRSTEINAAKAVSK